MREDGLSVWWNDTHIDCIHARYWGGNNPDRFFLVVCPKNSGNTYMYDSMEG